jgi:hypothetical protein
MAIIPPSLKFEGSDLNLSQSSTPYIKEVVRRAVFNKSTNKDGAYLYFLPGYKADSNGSGVWFKKIYIRDNFGVNFKEKYYVANRAADPAEYFANNFRMLYPEEAKVTDQEVNGRKFKKYPNYGRVAERVLFNVAFSQNLSSGAHVLDLPLRNGADILMNWLEGVDIHNNPRQPINHHERCVPVFVKLREATANPWMIQVESNSPVALPTQLADSDYLYNLDDIFVIKPKEEIISKLREMYPADVFDDCMDGFPGLTRASSQGAVVQKPAAPSKPTAIEDNLDLSQVAAPRQLAPILDIPKANISAPVAAVNPPAAVDISNLPANPMATARLSREEALRFISQ